MGKERYLDFFGVNYYSRGKTPFSPNPAMLFVKLERKEVAATNDLGWEIYPEGLEEQRCHPGDVGSSRVRGA